MFRIINKFLWTEMKWLLYSLFVFHSPKSQMTFAFNQLIIDFIFTWIHCSFVGMCEKSVLVSGLIVANVCRRVIRSRGPKRPPLHLTEALSQQMFLRSAWLVQSAPHPLNDGNGVDAMPLRCDGGWGESRDIAPIEWPSPPTDSPQNSMVDDLYFDDYQYYGSDDRNYCWFLKKSPHWTNHRRCHYQNWKSRWGLCRPT